DWQALLLPAAHLRIAIQALGAGQCFGEADKRHAGAGGRHLDKLVEINRIMGVDSTLKQSGRKDFP
ncbi:MAG: hypothetical protein PHT15_05145, partial [Gallionellaceae bacterium]|nr:hypothetical protein [Gallionellaceae bacterium]